MTKEEKELFTRIISAGPLLMLGGGYNDDYNNNDEESTNPQILRLL